MREAYGRVSGGLVKLRWPIVALYVISNGAIFYFTGQSLGREIFPQVDTGELQMRLRAPSGTRVEETERIVQRVLARVNDEFGEGTLETSIGFVGVQPSSFPVNTVFLWTSGPHEAVMKRRLGRRRSKPSGRRRRHTSIASGRERG